MTWIGSAIKAPEPEDTTPKLQVFVRCPGSSCPSYMRDNEIDNLPSKWYGTVIHASSLEKACDWAKQRNIPIVVRTLEGEERYTSHKWRGVMVWPGCTKSYTWGAIMGALIASGIVLLLCGILVSVALFMALGNVLYAHFGGWGIFAEVVMLSPLIGVLVGLMEARFRRNPW